MDIRWYIIYLDEIIKDLRALTILFPPIFIPIIFSNTKAT